MTVDFGDGNTDTIPCPADRTSTRISHIYYSTGQYRVTASAVDEHGAVSNEVAVWILIHDPSVGLNTKGKGNISTALGDRHLYEAENLIDAKFEFAAKYKQCATPDVPTGYISFEFDDGTSFIFESQTLDWLIFETDDDIKKAMFKGHGTVNGEGSYTFIAALQDTGKPSKSSKSSQEAVTDTFRIKITDDADDTVVYDSMPGIGEDSFDGAEVIKGDVKIKETGKKSLKTRCSKGSTKSEGTEKIHGSKGKGSEKSALFGGRR